MEMAIEKLVAICCFVIGLSHILQPRAWVQLFLRFRERDELGIIYTGLLHFPLGALVVAFHNVWQGLPTIVTILGWGWLIKGLVYLCSPKHGMRMMDRVSLEKSREFVIAGIVLIALSPVIAYALFPEPR